MSIRRAAWQRIGGGLIAGGMAGFGQAPYDLPIVMMIALVVVFRYFPAQQTARQAALFGWAFGAGYFAHTLHWIVSPFMVDVARHGWMAPFALVLMAGGLALFWGLAFWMARRLSATASWPLALCLAAVELLRAHIFTGFPWAMAAQALVDVAAGQLLAFTGPHLLNLLIFAAAAALALVLRDPLRRTLQMAVLVVVLAGLLLPVLAPPATLTEHTVRLVQPNATQREKMDPANDMRFFERQLTLTAAPHVQGVPSIALTLWPEVAVPWPLDSMAPALSDIATASGDSPVALGVIRRTPHSIHNAMAVVGAGGAVLHTYDKHHLVPFGEYVPFADFMADYGIFGLAAQMWRGISPGSGPAVLDMGPLGKALPLICYEAIFPHGVRAAPERPDFMIQLTNDAWFGKGAGPRQHLAQARMRAIEQGLPLARAANTGISAMIDPQGRLVDHLALNTAGFIDVGLPAPGPATLYARSGDLPFLILLLIGFIAVFVQRRTQ